MNNLTTQAKAQRYCYTLKRNYMRDMISLVGEVNDEPSQTIQDDSYTIEELVAKYKTGLYYASEDQFLDADLDSEAISFHRPRLDLVDAEQIQQYKLMLEDELQEAKGMLNLKQQQESEETETEIKTDEND